MNELWTLLRAETIRRLRSRVFVIATLGGVLGLGVTLLLPYAITTRADHDVAVLIGPADLTAAAKELIKPGETVAAMLPPGTPVNEELFRAHKASEAIVLERGGDARLHVTVWAKDISQLSKRPYGDALAPLNAAVARGTPPSEAAGYQDFPIDVRGVDTKYASRDASMAASGIGFAFTFLLYIAVIIQSTSIMSAVVEEKTSRIAEILVSIVNPANLMVAKIISSAIAATIQVLVWLTAGAFIGIAILGNVAKSAKGPDAADAAAMSRALSASSAISVHAVLWFFIWFAVGFLQCSLLIAGVAALVTRTEEMQSITLPVIMPVAAAFILATFALNDPGAKAAVVTSYLPLFAPFVMYARSIVGNVPIWQQVVSLALNGACVWLFAVLGGKLYRAGMLSTGGPPNFKQFLAILRS